MQAPAFRPRKPVHQSHVLDAWATKSMCPKCYATVPATVAVEGGSVYLLKRCDACEHVERVMIERCAETYRALHARTETSEYFHQRFGVTILPVTDRCNVACPHCYHVPGAQPDPSIDEVLALARTAKGNAFMLMGAEPTVRRDLPQLVRALKEGTGKDVHVYTNGVRLSDFAYVAALEAAGLCTACVSLHTPGYLGDERLWSKKQIGLRNLAAAGIEVEHISASVNGLEDIPNVLRAFYPHWQQPSHFRIRVPGKIGTCGTEPLFLSEFLPEFEAVCEAFGWKCEPMDGDNNPYHVWLRVAGKPFRIIRWPSVHEVDLGELASPPTALFVPEAGELNFVHAALVQEAFKLGKITRVPCTR